MTKANKPGKPGSHKPGPDHTKTTTTKKPVIGASSSPTGPAKPVTSKPQSEPSITLQTETARDRQGGKSGKQSMGGTAVPGAKSTQPKEVKATSPTQQQAESYNREMRRRMQHMGTGPYSEGPADTVRSRRQKRIEKRKKQQEEVKKTVVTRGPSTNIKLGRRNTYFMLIMVGILALIIILAIIIRHPF
jgi:hypothetical protein